MITNDLKYLFAYTIPVATLVSITSEGFFTYATPIYAFIFIPTLELIFKDVDSKEEYTKSEVQNKLSNTFFDILLYLNIPFVFGLLILGLFNLNQLELDLFETVGMVLSLGILLATNAINVGHELGHRKSFIERCLSKLLYLPCLYMHFYIEHNFGHHNNVATPKDPATAKFNQTVYSFWVTSVIGQYISAWRIQLQLLKIKNSRFFSFKNDMLYYTVFELAYLFVVYSFFGLYGLFLAVIIGILSFLFLETINYIEHYGLLRNKLPSGRYERVQSHHSWNSNHFIGRIVLYELTRHSDHHYKASKKYQILENKRESPQLPYGYPTSILLALVPWLWFSLVNPLLNKKA
ncbi:alkane 1-monooxygenase [Flavobacteriaceae bacterium]|jgi:alkane 1-monooxygenase|nr:alkane 1-monooxygenase [Flavobacteriaceae bacterium]